MTLKIGEKIKELRKAQDITQDKLADYLNISYQAISKWENGLALPDITLLPKLANFFGVSTDELLDLKTSENETELREYEKEYHELSLTSKSGFHLELHHSIMEKMPLADAVLARAWDFAANYDGYRFEFCPEYLTFYIIAHAAYHFLGGGCGVRAVLDIHFMKKSENASKNHVLSQVSGCKSLDFLV